MRIAFDNDGYRKFSLIDSTNSPNGKEKCSYPAANRDTRQALKDFEKVNPDFPGLAEFKEIIRSQQDATNIGFSILAAQLEQLRKQTSQATDTTIDIWR